MTWKVAALVAIGLISVATVCVLGFTAVFFFSDWGYEESSAIDGPRASRILDAAQVIDDRCNPMYTGPKERSLVPSRKALDVILQEDRKNPIDEFTIHDDLGPSTKSTPRDRLSWIVVTTMNTDCDEFARKAQREIFRSMTS
jgi:hypothetical protein